MSAILQHIVSFVLIYRYPTLFIVSFLSSLGIPLPAAATAVAAASFASQGYLNISLLVLFGAGGNIIGDLTMYFLMRRYGKRVLRWVGLRKVADSIILKDVEKTVDQYKTWVIIASRFQDQATTVVNIIAGLGKMSIKRFALLVSIGDFMQIIFYIGIGVIFANSWQAVYDALGKFGWIVALVLAISIAFLSTKGAKRVFKGKI